MKFLNIPISGNKFYVLHFSTKPLQQEKTGFFVVVKKHSWRIVYTHVSTWNSNDCSTRYLSLELPRESLETLGCQWRNSGCRYRRWRGFYREVHRRNRNLSRPSHGRTLYIGEWTKTKQRRTGGVWEKYNEKERVSRKSEQLVFSSRHPHSLNIFHHFFDHLKKLK